MRALALLLLAALAAGCSHSPSSPSAGTRRLEGNRIPTRPSAPPPPAPK